MFFSGALHQVVDRRVVHCALRALARLDAWPAPSGRPPRGGVGDVAAVGHRGGSLRCAPWPWREPIHLRPAAPLAERVLLPGDPHRALAVAQALLDQPRMFNHARGLWGYTGTARRRAAAHHPVHGHGRAQRGDRRGGADRPRGADADPDRHLRGAGRRASSWASW